MASSHSSLKPAVPKSTSAATSAHIRVALAMSTELDRMAWSIIIGKQADMELAVKAASSRQVLELLNSEAPDVLLIDEDILMSCDQVLLARANRSHPFHVIVVAMHEQDYSMERPSCSLHQTRLLKGVSSPKLLDAIRACAKKVENQPSQGME